MTEADIEMLEKRGVEAVLLRMAKGLYGLPGSQLRSEVEGWLRSKQVAADREASFKRDAREKETLAIAKEANRIARDEAAAAARSARWAKIAAIIAAIAAIAGPIITAWLTKN